MNETDRNNSNKLNESVYSTTIEIDEESISLTKSLNQFENQKISNDPSVKPSNLNFTGQLNVNKQFIQNELNADVCGRGSLEASKNSIETNSGLAGVSSYCQSNSQVDIVCTEYSEFTDSDVNELDFSKRGFVKKISELINTLQNHTLNPTGADEWENDDDNGYTIVALSEEEFYDFEEDLSKKLLTSLSRADRNENVVTGLNSTSKLLNKHGNFLIDSSHSQPNLFSSIVSTASVAAAEDTGSVSLYDEFDSMAMDLNNNDVESFLDYQWSESGTLTVDARSGGGGSSKGHSSANSGGGRRKNEYNNDNNDNEGNDGEDDDDDDDDDLHTIVTNSTMNNRPVEPVTLMEPLYNTAKYTIITPPSATSTAITATSATSVVSLTNDVVAQDNNTGMKSSELQNAYQADNEEENPEYPSNTAAAAAGSTAAFNASLETATCYSSTAVSVIAQASVRGESSSTSEEEEAEEDHLQHSRRRACTLTAAIPEAVGEIIAPPPPLDDDEEEESMSASYDGIHEASSDIGICNDAGSCNSSAVAAQHALASALDASLVTATKKFGSANRRKKNSRKNSASDSNNLNDDDDDGPSDDRLSTMAADTNTERSVSTKSKCSSSADYEPTPPASFIGIPTASAANTHHRKSTGAAAAAICTGAGIASSRTGNLQTKEVVVENDDAISNRQQQQFHQQTNGNNTKSGCDLYEEEDMMMMQSESEQLAVLLASGGFGSPSPSGAVAGNATNNSAALARSSAAAVIGNNNTTSATSHDIDASANTQHHHPSAEQRRQSVGEKRRNEIMGQQKFQGADGIHCFFNLKVIFDPFRTGFEAEKDLAHPKGTIIAGRYEVFDVLGQAAFSTALQCIDLAAEEDEAQWVCLKVIKNNKDFFDQSLDEIKLLQYINSCGDPDKHNVLRLIDFFYCKEHLFIVSELLKENLYEFGRFIKESDDAPYYTIPRLKRIIKQVLQALVFIHSLKLIHCDIKPENIVIKSFSRCEVKLIDFGSSCFTSDHLTTYIQSRSYRAPEVILGHHYDARIDIWSVGAVLAELHTGYVLFQNESIATMLSRITGILGPFPPHVLKNGSESSKYFSAVSNIVYERDDDGSFQLIFPKKTDLASRLHLPNSNNSNNSRYNIKEDQNAMTGDQELFLDFVRQLLHLDPLQRPTAQAALCHPWLADADTIHVSEYIIGQGRGSGGGGGGGDNNNNRTALPPPPPIDHQHLYPDYDDEDDDLDDDDDEEGSNLYMDSASMTASELLDAESNAALEYLMLNNTTSSGSGGSGIDASMLEEYIRQMRLQQQLQEGEDYLDEDQDDDDDEEDNDDDFEDVEGDDDDDDDQDTDDAGSSSNTVDA